MKSFEIAKQLIEAEKNIETVVTRRPGLLSELLQADAEGDTKAISKIRGDIANLDLEIDKAKQNRINLESALDRSILDEIDQEIQNIPEQKQLMKAEIEGAAEEIGELLARVLYLEKHYLPGEPYSKWLYKTSPYGGPAEIPEHAERAYEFINHSMTAAKLEGSDPVAESFQARSMALRDAQALGKDPNSIKYKIHKRRSILLRDAKGSV